MTGAARLDAAGAAAVGLVLGCMCCSGCRRPPPDSTPDGAVRMFLDEMDSTGDDPAASRRVYDLLGPSARANLSERARRTSGLLGVHAQPWQMLAPGLFGMAFRPQSMRPSVVGNHAVVDVIGEDPRTEHARVAVVREPTGWKVEPGFPPP